MAIKIHSKKHEGVPLLEIHGKISGGDAIKLSKKLEALVKKKGDYVLVDLSFINFLDSHWLGVLVYCWKLFNEYNKKLVFVIPPGYIRELFESANLDRTFTIIDSLDAFSPV